MAESKKFGTFAGVFTPSILTILGVIMYLRLGWVVGNAGVWGAIIIILIAHVISLATGLSISSIATDKKVGPGGVYYVLSRSLGLPIGGAIGITLFVGTALSIALYLVGFAESFNSYVGFDTSINGLRITGSIALLTLMTIALISTAVALKTQFIIMAAIGVSLISIFLGLAGQESQPINSFGVEGGASMEMVFAIFFPAVTGFTAGIAMSGDLKNSKKAIPSGTLWAIIVGLIVYIVLAIAISSSINSGLLVTDNNALLAVAYSAPAVVAGIWGATLSSALGGILGGPRILQAMSIDKITPQIFGKGRGKDKEPWNALFLVIFIAQCGILIGELDLIARVVSMFYLAAYGFINISFVLESWASTDFNPSFKVRKWIGMVGAIACFAVMFKLDMLAMFAAFAVIGGIYFWLHRKQVSLGTGDIWHSVWNSVVQKGLKKLEDKEDHLRNWKPNVLLFSGGTNQRPHLLELSRSLSGKSGMVTNFDLVENPEAKILFPKHKQVVKDPLLEMFGIFGRKIEVQNVFKGIEGIASTFGFSGVEPNSVLMGWAKNTADPLWFAQMTKRLIELDLNVMYLDYDERFGFGQKQTIDIWWRDLNDNVQLSLNIIKFLSQSDDWRNAQVRVIVVNNTLDEGIERKIHAKLDMLRVKAVVKVVNNAIERRPFYEIMESISEGTDLILAGIPEIKTGEEVEFVSNTNLLFRVLGTTLLLKSSSLLEEDNRVTNVELALPRNEAKLLTKEKGVLTLPEDENLKAHVTLIHAQLQNLGTEITQNELGSFKNKYATIVAYIQEIVIEELSTLSKNKNLSISNIRKSQIKLLQLYNQKIEEFGLNDIPYLADKIMDLSELFCQRIDEIISNQPASVLTYPSALKLIPNKEDNTQERSAKKKKNALKWMRKPKVVIPFRKMVEFHLTQSGYENALSFQRKIGLSTHTYQNQIREVFIENLQILEALMNEKYAVTEAIYERFSALNDLLDEQHDYLYTYLFESATFLTNAISADVDLISAADLAQEMKNKKSFKLIFQNQIKEFSQFWIRNQNCASSQTSLDNSLHTISYALSALSARLKSEIKDSMFDKSHKIISDAMVLIEQTESLLEKNDLAGITELDFDTPETIGYNDLAIDLIMTEIQQLVSQVPETIEALDEESRNKFAFEQGRGVKTFTIDILHIVDYLIDQQVQVPLEKELQLIPIECMKNLGQLIQNLRLINFTVGAQISEEDKRAQLTLILNQTAEIILLSDTKMKAFEKKSVGQLDDIFATCMSNLNASYIIEEARELESVSRDGLKKSKRLNWLNAKKGSVNEKWSGILARLNSKREELNFLGFKHQNKANENGHAKMRSFLETLTPSEKTLRELPFYYQQLFIGKHAPKMEFLKNRSRELSAVELAISRIKNGAQGGILVIGDSLAGKTFFSEIVAKKYTKEKVFKIDAPITGSPRKKDFLHILQKHLKSNNSTISMIEDAPKGSCFIFDDIELWWERSSNGAGVLEQMTEIIEKYSQQYIFIVNCNLSAFKSIKLSLSFENYFISTIQLSPFGANQIMETIITRHKAGGLEFVLNGVQESEVSERSLRKLMEEHARLSGGNIGVALHLWQANIEQVEKNRISIKHPSKMEMPLFTDAEWQVLLVQFVIHKHLTLTRIKRIFNFKDKNKGEELLNNLMRSGLIEQIMGSTYRISPYHIGAITKYLKESKVL